MNDSLNVPAPPRKKTTKGAPPVRTQTKENLEKPHTGELKDLNFKVPAEFKKEFQQLALDEDKSCKELLMDLFAFYKSKGNM